MFIVLSSQSKIASSDAANTDNIAILDTTKLEVSSHWQLFAVFGQFIAKYNDNPNAIYSWTIKPSTSCAIGLVQYDYDMGIGWCYGLNNRESYGWNGANQCSYSSGQCSSAQSGFAKMIQLRWS